MDEIFISIMERLGAELPQLSLIDEDYGQLETADDTYPVTFPCALISNAETEWQDVKLSAQRGSSQLTVKLAIDCYDDTHYSSGTYEAVRWRFDLVRQLVKALHGFRPSQAATALSRVRSSSYTLPGGIKVYEAVFAFRVAECF